MAMKRTESFHFAQINKSFFNSYLGGLFYEYSTKTSDWTFKQILNSLSFYDDFLNLFLSTFSSKYHIEMVSLQYASACECLNKVCGRKMMGTGCIERGDPESYLVEEAKRK